MTEMQGTSDRRAKRMRRIARTLAVVWAGGWTVLLVSTPALLEFMDDSLAVFGARQPRTFSQLTLWGQAACRGIAFLVLVSWAAAATAWRWEAIGGVVLVLLAGLVLPAAYALLLVPPEASGNVIGAFAGCFPGALPTGLLGLAAGILFLASWSKSRKWGGRHASE